MKLEFSRQIFEKIQYQISWKSVQWEPRHFHADRRTDRHDGTNTRFSQFLLTPPITGVMLHIFTLVTAITWQPARRKRQFTLC